MGRTGPGKKLPKTRSWVRKRSFPDPYIPTIWIDGPEMYATCAWLKNKTFVDTKQANRLTFENRLWRALKDDWGVLAQTLTLDYQKGRVRINFNDDQEFIMTKLLKNE